ncbi:MAG: NAD(P)-dependent oxidoreductase, partial [Alphaproteobacteria bacterium]|nr:NAD(P)-dependent oxidoreductase [Alphaproteobacteria bacterium]
MAANAVGFIGLGNMGAPMCANLVKAGFEVAAFDAAGTPGRAPEGAKIAGGIADLVAGVETVFLSLPDGPVVRRVCEDILAVKDRHVERV